MLKNKLQQIGLTTVKHSLGHIRLSDTRSFYNILVMTTITASVVFDYSAAVHFSLNTAGIYRV